MLAIGDLFADRYRLLQEKGSGGTAVIFLAFDQEANRQVALKIFKSGLLGPAILNEMWHREATALSKISHPNIIQFDTAGRCEKTNFRYIALEWFDGKSLDEVLNNSSAVTFERFMDLYGNVILDALIYSAGLGILHRDLSPRNILSNSLGELKIIDFGQAKIGQGVIGHTVAGYATPPYCPPEPDTGTYTATRDAYSFAAITIRAISGRLLRDHDELYDAFASVKCHDHYYNVLASALSREPSSRPQGISQFGDALRTTSIGGNSTDKYKLFIRFTAEVQQTLTDLSTADYDAKQSLLDELNEAASISAPKDEQLETRFVIETRSYRLYADVDRYTNTVIAIFRVHRVINVAGFWWNTGWQPELEFINKLPLTEREKSISREDMRNFYAGYSQYLQRVQSASSSDAIRTFDSWHRLLDAMAEIERTKVPSLHYSKPQVEQNRLIVDIENPQDAEIGQQRVISTQRKQIFSGEIESIKGDRCTLVSKWNINSDEGLPRTGTLDIDWKMARVAIQRQRNALEKFADGTLLNKSLADYVILRNLGEQTPTYYPNPQFFDKSLDDDKKAIVSRFLTMKDILLIHGPPGTGKTTLIVELIRQYLAIDKSRRILLVAQTHGALDHALSGVLKHDPALRIVRIDSGTRQLSENVRVCSLESRNAALRKQVQNSTERFLEAEAESLGVSLDDIKLGMHAIDLLRCRDAERKIKIKIDELEQEVCKLREDMDNRSSMGLTTINADALQSGIRSIDDELFELNGQFSQSSAERVLSEARLGRLGENGKSLLRMDDAALDEWRDTLLAGEKTKRLKELMETIEEWKLKFGQSQDFKTALIADSQIVSGTCVGFCRETAAANSEYDLCIVDEASKATTTELMVPMCQARQVVLVGDHHQLPAVIDFALLSREMREDYGLDEGQLDLQLFELLQRNMNDGEKANLQMQFRMRSQIGDLISECFYEGNLKTDSMVDQRKVVNLTVAGLDEAVTWIDTSMSNGRGERAHNTSYLNPLEGECIIKTLKRIAFALEAQTTKDKLRVGLISGYSEQVKYLQRAVDSEPKLSGMDIECSTVHQFQGREVDICFYSVTRDNNRGDIGFLSDWRHLNVALSRARNFLVIVGSRSFCNTITADNPFYNLLSYFETTLPDRFTEWNDDND